MLEKALEKTNGCSVEKFCVTIDRGFGSWGKTIGVKLAEKLGIEYYDRDLSRLSADYSGINERLFVNVDEKNVKSRLFHRSTPVDLNATLSPDDETFVSDDNLFRLQAKVIRDLADKENCVIIGRCGSYVLADVPHAVRVFVHAPLEVCIKNVEQRYGVDAKEAARLIEQADSNRRAYYKYYTGGKVWGEAVNYDLTINTAKIGADKAVELILDYIRIRGAR